MARDTEADSRGTLKVLSKMVDVLESFSATDRELSLAELARRSGLPKSTTHRHTATLREIGFLDQARYRDRYRLGLKLFQFGSLVIANMDLHREARPCVDALTRLSGEKVHLCVFDGLQAVIIHIADSASQRRDLITTIEAAPAYCTGTGKAALAFQDTEAVERVINAGLKRFTRNTITDPEKLRAHLAEVRKRGYSIDNCEHQPGVRCVGAPIRNTDGTVFASMSVMAPARRLPLSKAASVAELVIHHANVISERIGYRA